MGTVSEPSVGLYTFDARPPLTPPSPLNDDPASRMLAGYALEAIPVDTWFVASLPGNHEHDAAPVHARERSIQRNVDSGARSGHGTGSREQPLGALAAPLMGWNKDRAMGQPLRQHLYAVHGMTDEAVARAPSGTWFYRHLPSTSL